MKNTTIAQAAFLVLLPFGLASCVTSGDLRRIEEKQAEIQADGIVTQEEREDLVALIQQVADDAEARTAALAKAPSLLGLPGGQLTDYAVGTVLGYLGIRNRHRLGMTGTSPKNGYTDGAKPS